MPAPTSDSSSAIIAKLETTTGRPLASASNATSPNGSRVAARHDQGPGIADECGHVICALPSGEFHLGIIPGKLTLERTATYHTNAHFRVAGCRKKKVGTLVLLEPANEQEHLVSFGFDAFWVPRRDRVAQRRELRPRNSTTLEMRQHAFMNR